MLVAASQKVMTKSWQNGNDFSSTKNYNRLIGERIPFKTKRNPLQQLRWRE